jgi:hypothetical protein
MLGAAMLYLSVLISRRMRTALQVSSTTGFYLLAALLTWVLALGPTLILMGEPRGFQAPFALLTDLPGFSSLRVPARFWLLTTMCLAALVGLAAAPILQGRRRLARALMVLATASILADGWIARLPSAPRPARVPDAMALEAGMLLDLPMDSLRDIAAGFRAVTGGWQSVNGYSGYFPGYYWALADAMRDEDDSALRPLLALGDLHVIVPLDATGARRMIERQPGSTVTAENRESVQYRLAARPTAPPADIDGERLRILELRASCGQSTTRYAADDDEATYWDCGPQRPGQELIVDLGRVARVAAVVQNLERHHLGYPRELRIETSLDASSWDVVWNGSVRGLLIERAIHFPSPSLRIPVRLHGRPARYLRLTQMGTDPDRPWTLAELEVWSGSGSK